MLETDCIYCGKRLEDGECDCEEFRVRGPWDALNAFMNREYGNEVTQFIKMRD